MESLVSKHEVKDEEEQLCTGLWKEICHEYESVDEISDKGKAVLDLLEVNFKDTGHPLSDFKEFHTSIELHSKHSESVGTPISDEIKWALVTKELGKLKSFDNIQVQTFLTGVKKLTQIFLRIFYELLGFCPNWKRIDSKLLQLMARNNMSKMRNQKSKP